MVGNITSLTNNGLRDWLIQRVTAIVLGVYFTFFIVYFVSHPNLSFQEWHRVFECMVIKVMTVIAMLSIVLHGWIGIWTVTTDYVRHSLFRLTLQMFVALFFIAAFIWVLAIVWSV